jgi:hypothetical protein
MATANFNTQIISSNSDEQLQYNLDEVITKDFDSGIRGYIYNFINDGPPIGVSLSDENNRILTIPPNTTFTLSIVVFNGDKGSPIESIATTNVTVESPVNAEFNTEILSSRQDGKELSYNLDMVIDKNFEGPYLYWVDTEKLPVGVGIKDGILVIPSNVEFGLHVTVSDEGRVNVANAYTEVVLEPDAFIEEITKLLNNQTLQEKFSNTKNDWAKIINRGTNEKVDDGIKYPGGDVIKEL